MPIDPIPEPHPPPTLQISLDVLPPLDPLIQLKHLLVLPPGPQPRHRHRKREPDPVHALPQHQIRIRQHPPVEPLPAPTRLAPQHALKVAEEFRQAGREEVGGFALRFRLLLLVVRTRGDRVVRVVGFVAEAVEGGERELVDAIKGFGVVFGACEAEFGA